MQECLAEICKDFAECTDFLTDKTDKKIRLVNRLFEQFMECFSNLKEEKLDYPKEFINDVRYYIQDNEPLVKKFEDVEMRYLMLSDFYDFCRITKKI